MGREGRIEYEGAIYHVIQRGNNKEYIFSDEIKKKYLVKCINDAKISLEFKLFAYVIMDNHYHLLVQTGEQGISKVMHRINSKYSKYFNYKQKHIGHVFGGRYKGILVQDDRYLLTLVRYIHQNPVRAGICKGVEEYEWSSDIFYKSNKSHLVDTEMVLGIISNNHKESYKKYREYMQEEETQNYEDIKIIGSEAFKLLNSERKKVLGRKRLDEILIETGVTNEEYRLIKDGSRKRHLTKYKIKYVEKALEFKYTNKEIGDNINISDAAVYQLVQKINKT